MPGPDPSPSAARTGLRSLRTVVLAVGGGAALFLLATGLHHLGTPSHPSKPADAKPTAPISFTPPPDDRMPDNETGASIRRGQAIFMNTGANAREFVGNRLACANCHLDAGRKADAAPFWAAWVNYPKYRSKNKQINTLEDRMKGCFSYSMNAQDSSSGGPPPPGHDVYRDLQTYAHWLATGAPTGAKLAGTGYPKLKKTALGYDIGRGSVVYATHCVICHGADGQGQQDISGRTVFPPLWGAQSYNWGAGMAQINNAAGFVRANMPLGRGYSLTEQQAWDVAAFIDSHERPKDPRQKGTVEENAKAHHGGDTYYGKRIDGRLIGVGTP